MIALLDGDIYAYRVGYTTNDIDINLAKWRLDEMVSNTLEEVGTGDYRIFLSDSEGNFRLKLYPQYKANRVAPKPKWLEELKEHLIIKWGAQIAFGQEADDALGINQTEETIICSIDKDLKQIPGHHYNFVKKEFDFVVDGTKFFYTQLLTGDVVDNIHGVQGIGIAKATKILSGSESEDSLFDAARKTYEERCGEEGLFLMLLYGRLLKIRTRKDELWHFPKLDIQLP